MINAKQNEQLAIRIWKEMAQHPSRSLRDQALRLQNEILDGGYDDDYVDRVWMVLEEAKELYEDQFLD